MYEIPLLIGPTHYVSSIQINGSEKLVGRELHIAYRYGDHYDSVRPFGDNSESPAQLRLEVRGKKSGSFKNTLPNISTIGLVLFIKCSLFPPPLSCVLPESS